MIDITLNDIVKASGGELIGPSPEGNIKGISIDTRTIREGDVYIALRGRNYDGHDFVEEAVRKGATAVIADDTGSLGGAAAGVGVVVVDDTVEAMGRVAADIRSRVDIPVVCITGTNGKTTVKEILTRILSSKYRVLSSRASYNNMVGLSLTLFELEASHEAAVLELGTSAPGEIPRLAAVASPYMALVNNIGDGHLESFVTREGVYLEKISLLDHLPECGIAFLNKDDVLLARSSVRHVMRRFFGRTPGSDFLISGVLRRDDGYEFCLNGNRYILPMEGQHNVHNAAAAICIAEYFGMRYDEIRAALMDVRLPGMRLERKVCGDLTFINDAYNSNPDSFENALRVLKEAGTKGKRVVVAGDMRELGIQEEEFHRMIGRSIAAKGIDLLIVLGERSRFIAEGALEAGMPAGSVFKASGHDEAARIVSAEAMPGSVVLLKGSRAERLEEVLRCFITYCTR